MAAPLTDDLDPGAELFNDYHARIVHLGKTVCRKSPLCDRCPIRAIHGSLRCAGARA